MLTSIKIRKIVSIRVFQGIHHFENWAIRKEKIIFKSTAFFDFSEKKNYIVLPQEEKLKLSQSPQDDECALPENNGNIELLNKSVEAMDVDLEQRDPKTDGLENSSQVNPYFFEHFFTTKTKNCRCLIFVTIWVRGCQLEDDAIVLSLMATLTFCRTI